MIDAVIDLLADPHHCNCGGVGDAPVRHLYGGWLPADDLKGIEVHVDRMRIAGQVDEAPDLRTAHHGEEIGPVFESSGDRAPATDLFILTSANFDQSYLRFIGPSAFSQLPHCQH